MYFALITTLLFPRRSQSFERLTKSASQFEMQAQSLGRRTWLVKSSRHLVTTRTRRHQDTSTTTLQTDSSRVPVSGRRKLVPCLMIIVHICYSSLCIWDALKVQFAAWRMRSGHLFW